MNKKKGALEAIEDNATRLSGDKPLFKVLRLRVYMQIPLNFHEIFLLTHKNRKNF